MDISSVISAKDRPSGRLKLAIVKTPVEAAVAEITSDALFITSKSIYTSLVSPLEVRDVSAISALVPLFRYNFELYNPRDEPFRTFSALGVILAF